MTDRENDDPLWGPIMIVCCIISGVLMLAFCAGCAHVPAPAEVIPCLPVTVYQPAIDIPERPRLQSSGWTSQEVAQRPADFAAALAMDMANIVGAYLELEANARASNSTRPGVHPIGGLAGSDGSLP